MITIITTYMYKNEICRRHEITCVTRYIISTKKKFLPSNRVIISFPALRFFLLRNISAIS